MSNIQDTLQERGNRYGEFKDHAHITQAIKDIFTGKVSGCTTNWQYLSDPHKESLEMVAHKIGRILNGDPNYKDSWHDIAGYAKLAEEECIEK